MAVSDTSGDKQVVEPRPKGAWVQAKPVACDVSRPDKHSKEDDMIVENMVRCIERQHFITARICMPDLTRKSCTQIQKCKMGAINQKVNGSQCEFHVFL